MVLASWALIGRKSCYKLTCIGFNDKEKYTLKLEYENTKKAYRALYEKNKDVLRVEAYYQVSQKQADKFFDYKKMQIMGLYEDAKSPYPGVISDRITCEERYRPKFIDSKNNSISLKLYSGYLNGQMQFGSCIDDQLVYRNNAVMFYCPGQQIWYQLEFIGNIKLSDKTELDSIKTINCKN